VDWRSHEVGQVKITRYRQIDGAHIEYFRGIENPVGVKVGPTMQPEELVRLLDILDSKFEDGKISLITRYGHDKIGSFLATHIKAVSLFLLTIGPIYKA
jgi:3-deoxy-7-phosphoheptulonate synthase